MFSRVLEVNDRMLGVYARSRMRVEMDWSFGFGYQESRLEDALTSVNPINVSAVEVTAPLFFAVYVCMYIHLLTPSLQSP